MKLLKKCILGAALAAALPVTALADTTWSYNWAAADTALGVGNARPLSFATDELKFTAESIVRFTDMDGSNTITAGDTFVDYIVVRIDQLFFGGNSNGETANGYGPGGVREITLTAILSGVQATGTSYTVNPGGILNWLYDGGPNFTSASFGTLSTFTDGNGVAGAAVNVEDGVTVPPSGGLNSPTFPDGTINVFMLMQDLLTGADFEVGPTGGILSMQLGISDGNNNVCTDSGGTAACFSTIAAMQTFFGIAGPGAGEFQFHTRTDGSFIKQAIPEPGSLALAALALIGLGVAGRRRKA